jgi:endonuclease/exonuclease/phosphatase family metal-dependent hydrolase
VSGLSRTRARFGVFLITLLLATGCASTRPPNLAVRTSGTRPVMAIVTWNMHAGRGDLSRLVDDLVSGRLTGAPVRDYIIFLQEAVEGREHDVAAFGRERQLSAIFVPVRLSDRGSSGNAIVTTRPLLSARVIDLPRERRVRKAVAVTIEIEDVRLFAVCAHLENRTSWLKGALFSDSARGRQARALLGELPGGPGIVGGDLNTWLGPDEPAWRMLLQRFTDTPREPTEPTFRDRLVLDHLFFDLPERWGVAREVVQERYGSDHNPVLGVIFQMGRP